MRYNKKYIIIIMTKYDINSIVYSFKLIIYILLGEML